MAGQTVNIYVSRVQLCMLLAAATPTLPSTRIRACHWFLRLLLPTPMNWLVR